MQHKSFYTSIALFEHHCIGNNVLKASSAILHYKQQHKRTCFLRHALSPGALSIVCRPNGKQVEQESMHQNKNQLLTRVVKKQKVE